MGSTDAGLSTRIALPAARESGSEQNMTGTEAMGRRTRILLCLAARLRSASFAWQSACGHFYYTAALPAGLERAIGGTGAAALAAPSPSCAWCRQGASRATPTEPVSWVPHRASRQGREVELPDPRSISH